MSSAGLRVAARRRGHRRRRWPGCCSSACRAGTRATTPATPAGAPAPAAPAEPGRKIKARLFYVADDGTRLTSVEREVPFAEGTVEQAQGDHQRADRAGRPSRCVSAVPPGTTLRALFITAQGEAYVDLSRELVDGASRRIAERDADGLHDRPRADREPARIVARCRCSSTARKWRRSPGTSICGGRS